MLPDYIEDLCEKWALVGSRVTCVPPPTDTDQDILVLFTPTKMEDAIEELRANRWKQDGDYGSLSEFVSFKSMESGTLINLILTDEPEWFDLFLEATELCRSENYLKKEDRIKCFNKVMGREEKKAKATAKHSKYQAMYQNLVAFNAATAAQDQGLSSPSAGGTGLSQAGSWPSSNHIYSNSFYSSTILSAYLTGVSIQGNSW